MTGLSLDASVNLELGSKVDDLKKSVDALLSRFPIPRANRVALTTQAASGTYQVIDLIPSGVPAGRFWDVRRVGVSGAGGSGDPFTTVGGSAQVIIAIGAAMGLVNNGNTSSLDPSFELVLGPGTIPNTTTWSRGTVSLLPGKHLYVIIKNPGSSFAYTATIGAEDYPIDLWQNP